ncbi:MULTISPECIES: response regulator transcription factor [unclassified Pseudomonas]|uniref:response regulator transcription factor n=1 Tax=Pseudomonas TaxID=286 RepID=UPI0016442108|nr:MULTISPECIES: response regulator transcription factor [unclassified Pseudomonas]QXI44615.1 response regulator transcription factor [Pseudomonas wayambapalatensis]HEK0909479.1 response regulator transcription factor [Pseudomonas putida]MBC3419377.1 response regulator transcription factor [Pseudomonas sp. RW3S2]MBC3466265.1 response regulator transcription factor [Pseudomonas sp. RW10S2]HEK1766719.1 response regulator transcription factor [Pseudomonas putida]
MSRVLVVDDHPFIRSTVCMLLRQERLEVVGQADNGIDALRLMRQEPVDLVILDITMPGLDGLEVIARMRSLEHPAKSLILTSQLAEAYSLRCMQAGAAGYVSKTDDLGELNKAVRAVLSGYTYFPQVTLSSVHRQDLKASEAQCIASLTDRELMVLQQLARGLSNKAIGDAMLLSNKTISTYKSRLLEKLRVRSLIDLADFARRNLLI